MNRVRVGQLVRLAPRWGAYVDPQVATVVALSVEGFEGFVELEPALDGCHYWQPRELRPAKPPLVLPLDV